MHFVLQENFPPVQSVQYLFTESCEICRLQGLVTGNKSKTQSCQKQVQGFLGLQETFFEYHWNVPEMYLDTM